MAALIKVRSSTCSTRSTRELYNTRAQTNCQDGLLSNLHEKEEGRKKEGQKKKNHPGEKWENAKSKMKRRLGGSGGWATVQIECVQVLAEWTE